MADFKNPAAAASRLRSAPIWLTDPHDRETVRQYLHELEAVARVLENDLSVLIACDKILTEHIYDYVCKRAGKTPVLDAEQARRADGRNDHAKPKGSDPLGIRLTSRCDTQ